MVVISGTGNTKLYPVFPNEIIWVVIAPANALFKLREVVMLNRGTGEVGIVLNDGLEFDVKLGESVDPLVGVLESKVEDVKLFQEGKDPGIDGGNVKEITVGSTNVVETIGVLLSRLEDVRAGGIPVLVRVTVNCADELMEDTELLVAVFREEELVSGISDVLGRAVEITIDDMIEELVRWIDEMLVGELVDNDEELGLIESDDKSATEVEEGVVFGGTFVDPCGEVLESMMMDEEPNEDGKLGLGNDKVKRLSGKLDLPRDVAVKGRVKVRVNPCETVLVIVAMPDCSDNVVDKLGVSKSEVKELTVLRIDQLDVYSTPVLATVDCTGAVGVSMEEAAGSPGVDGTEAEGLTILEEDRLDTYSSPVLLNMLVDRTGGRLGGMLLFSHWVVPSTTE